MIYFAVSFFVLVLFFLLMGVGIIFANKKIAGGCGSKTCICKEKKFKANAHRSGAI